MFVLCVVPFFYPNPPASRRVPLLLQAPCSDESPRPRGLLQGRLLRRSTGKSPGFKGKNVGKNVGHGKSPISMGKLDWLFLWENPGKSPGSAIKMGQSCISGVRTSLDPTTQVVYTVFALDGYVHIKDWLVPRDPETNCFPPILVHPSRVIIVSRSNCNWDYTL